MSPDLEIVDELLTDPQRAAEAAGLRYYTDSEPGYIRRRWGRGFTYLDLNRDHIQEADLRARFGSLAIPPAWQDVWICPFENGHLQATGRDDAGRKQYIYHEQWESVRNRAKFDRLLIFSEALPAIRRQVDRDLRRHGLPQEKALAIVVRLLEQGQMRIGNAQYARTNGTFGLTTLANEHLEVHGSRLAFTFRAKSGVDRRVELRDRRLARQIERCLDLPSPELFGYEDDQGTPQDISSTDVNEYLARATPISVTAKEFRTWAGTVRALEALCDERTPDDESIVEEMVADAVERVADHLGNTPAVCRDYYIHPVILQTFRDGSLFSIVAKARKQPADDPYALSPVERATASIICAHLPT